MKLKMICGTTKFSPQFCGIRQLASILNARNYSVKLSSKKSNENKFISKENFQSELSKLFFDPEKSWGTFGEKTGNKM